MNPMLAKKLMIHGGRLWRATGVVVRWAILGLTLTCGFPVAAQAPDAPAQTNDATAAEVLSQLSDLVQSTDSAQPEDMAPPNDLGPTNNLPQASAPASGGDRPNRFIRPDTSSRSQNDDRRSRGRRSLRSRSDQSSGSGSGNYYSSGSDRNQTNGVAGTNNGPVVLDYASFQLIVDRNIFDPNRFPHGPGVRVRQAPRSVDYVTLVGTMSYEKGTFAFFDGTSSDYKKVLKLTDSIAGYKVTTIAPNAVKLASGTNELELSVGAQLRREEDGPWLLSSQSTAYAATPASSSTNAAATTTAAGSDPTSGSAESDIIKRLMQKREKE
jgi:hypothetical protein